MLAIFRDGLFLICVFILLEPCVAFLKEQAKNLGLPVEICYPARQECPVVVITWKGLNPELPSILLNSHMDVVPVDESRWTHPPFGAEIDETGKIFARGAQDMKCCGTQYLAAIRAMQREGIKLQRTIIVTFVPDEEIGSEFGMSSQKLNVGFELKITLHTT